MENTIQPVLCCIGAEVAGEPTQFLMERASNAEHLDWRVITVEVAAEELASAWQGVSVMRFQAVRFFQSLQSAAMELVATPTDLDRFVGGITSAMRVGDQWQMWHNSGPGLIDALASRCRWPESVCWLHGDGSLQRSLFAACVHRPPLELFWTDGPPGIPETFARSMPHELIGAERAIDFHKTLAERLGQRTGAQRIGTAPAESGRGEASLVLVGTSDSQLEALCTCQPGFTCHLIVVKGSPGTRRRLCDSWKSGDIHVLSHADLVVSEEAYDQSQWLGHAANVELLREAYEEYADF